MQPSGNPDSYGIEPAASGGSSGGAPGSSERFVVTIDNGVHVVKITQSDVLDAFEIEQLKGELEAYVASVDGPRIVLDLGLVAHLSSSALGMLVAMKSLTEGNGGGLALCSLRPELMEIFRLTRLDKVLKIHGDASSAVAAL